MRSFTVAAAFAAMAVANPVPQPQGFDWKAIDALSAIPTVTIPVVDVAAKASTVAFDASAAASSIAAVVKSSGVDSTASSGLKVRAAAVTCKTQPPGAGPTVHNPDTPEAFLAYDYFKAQAVAAPTPGGYYNAFTNLQASNNAYGYMGYTLLNEYSTQACAAKCDAISGCASFNIYFERDPIKNPNDESCKNPASTTNIKCVFWGGPVNTENAKNKGQWRRDFRVVIAGSNGYVSSKIDTPPGYTDPIPLGNAAINAPFDCNGKDTYLGVRIFQKGPFDIDNCASACTAQADYARAHPPANGGEVKTCKYFNTYMLLKNGDSVGQYCALYDHSWSTKYATNFGQYRGSDKYTVAWSYISSNATDSAAACEPKA